ncbi:GNAT family N-acetyltransferase [Tolypothrix sp. FACHB-123]|uniref:GNAT family N-acetyltransferase n=1 Tax=Tolypothrix sp. FACHB-123 TaxID=2692868 RepID=UPI001684EEA7|nr:GNAT family N-acetyltransferase [Tolypothrix sp. FACHB-123]MBD2358385.1 GNAT family N-acetyltransferase [Tolypothrix sp. FACHB-123]
MKIDFKLAENTDVEAFLILMQELYEIDGCILFNAVVARNALIQLLNDKSMGQVWLIKCQSKTIGYVVLTLGYSLEYGGRDAWIDELYIQANYQGQGIGKQTINFLEHVCTSLNVQALHLEVERKNTSAQSFYRRVGFEDHNRYLMTKWLNKS